MSRQTCGVFFALAFLSVICTAAGAQKAVPQARSAVQATAAVAQAEGDRALINKYCTACHGGNSPRAGLSLTKFDIAHPEQDVQVAEKIIRKLRAGMMPPPGMPRPELAASDALVSHLETAIDKHAAIQTEPGRRSFQRLSRTEYANSVRDLLGIDVDVEGLLPPDTISASFDNIADSQQFSPTLMEGYIRAADTISREAVGDPSAEPASYTYKLDRTASQLRRVDGAPFGTRGGIVLTFNFPADGEYVFKMLLHGSPTGALYGSGGNFEGADQLEVSIDGERKALLTVDPKMSESTPEGLTLSSGPVTVKAGAHKVAAVFLQRVSPLFDDLITPIEHTLADTNIGIYKNVSTLPHLREFEIGGPFKTTGVSDTPSRQRIFVCRPISAAEELPCATKIVTALASKLYRRAPTAEDLEGLMTFYEQGRQSADFETGIRIALQAMLASPNFVFRLEPPPPGVKPGETYRIGDLELASRMSYFIWATAPDAQLLTVARQGKLHDPVVLEKETRRMLEDPRSEALATKFGAMWLRLPDLMRMQPDALMYPQYDHTVAMSMKRETELFFDSIVREDRNILDLLTANYTFLDERAAKHYGIANVLGNRFRRVDLTGTYREGLGLFGHGSIMTLTAVADRTSPVQRGKWVMEVLLGTPPPPPPPNVPRLTETKDTDNGKPLTVRERMEIHRANAVCASCHRMIDPIGLALENFDVTGQWRTLDREVPIDPSTVLFDGTAVKGPAELRDALLKHSRAIIGNFTEHLMTYALGRRVEYYDMPAIRAIMRDAAKNNNRFSSFVLGIIRSAAFQMSRAETTTAAK